MTGDSLIEYLERVAGEYHRGTVQYDDKETEVLHLRNDVREERLRSQIDRMLNRLRPESAPEEERAFPFGDLSATVRLFADAIILHFPVGRDRGIVVSLEPETARDLNTFIGECSARIPRE